MTKTVNLGIDWKSALGASRAIDVQTAQLQTPVDLLALCEEISTRIRSTGGRPTDPTWTVERQVPFREETWSALQEMSQELKGLNASASPAQLAALFVEQGIRALKGGTKRRPRKPHARSRRTPARA